MQLAKPDVVRCFFEQSFDPPLAAMALRWDAETAAACERLWQLPDNVAIKGPAPERFGVTICRWSEDAYRVRLLWNGLCLSWENLTRRQIMTSALASILGSLGTDVWYLLQQPLEDQTAIAA